MTSSRSLEIEDRITDAFCALGTTIAKAGSVEQLQRVDRDYVQDFGRVTKKLGAERLSVVSAIGADPKSINYFNRTKGEMEALLAELDLPSLRIFRPSLLLGAREERRPKEVVAGVVLGALSPLLAGPLRRYRGVEAAQVARAMYATSLEDFSAVRIFESDEIQGPSLDRALRHTVGGGASGISGRRAMSSGFLTTFAGGDGRRNPR